ncbi:MAG: AMP-binding protein [Neomegalonema sp.]|nr:AMP-binding protein [Neomegalonema sp.]
MTETPRGLNPSRQFPAQPFPAQLGGLYEQHLAQAPERVMIFDETGDLSYSAFHEQVLRMQGWLAAQGIGAGDILALWMVNRPLWLVTLFAAARLGAGVAAVNTRYRGREVTHILRKSGARLLILEPGFRKIDFPAILQSMDPADLPELRQIALYDAGDALPDGLLDRPVVALDLTAQSPASTPAVENADLPALLFTTSGTTKAPKLVCHSQRSLSWHACAAIRTLEMTAPGVRVFTGLPLCGVFGFNGILAGIAAGGAVVMLDAFDAARAAALMREHAVTHLFGSDEMYRRIAEAASGERPFPAARLFGFGAFHPGAAHLVAELEARGLPLSGVYGSSEVQALCANWRSDDPQALRVQGGGRMAAGDDGAVRARDPQTGALLDHEEPGELELRHPGLFTGYFNDPEATAQAMTADGFFRSGDLGYTRADGSFVYLSRMGDSIRLAGYLVNPVEIDDAIKEVPGVADVQTVGIEHQGRTMPVAFIIAEPGAGLGAETVRADLKARLASFKIPERIWFVDAFPTTESANGQKIKRNTLREMAAAHIRAETETTS